MSGWSTSRYRPGVNQSTIMFSRKVASTSFSYSNYSNQNCQNDPSSQKLFLLSKFCNFPIFETIPKLFSISTKNGTSHFNIIMLSEFSPVISKYIQENPKELHYSLDINDEENVLGKFEQLFQGKTVIFTEDDLPSSQRITKMLQITNCPNYLKPESLKISEFYSNGNKASSWNNINIQSGVVIFHDMFVEYLKSDSLKKFTIKTAKNEYKCSIFGIYSSDVIHQILEQNPTTQEYVYDFEDEYDEFQLICDLFNFKEINIKSDNMNILKEIAEDLKINCIIKQLDDFIKSYEKFSEKVDEQQSIIDSIDNLFDLLYNIKNIGIGKVKLSIVQSKWSQTYENVQELAAFILQVVKPNYYLQTEMVNLLIELNKEANESNELSNLIPFIVETLLSFYFPIKQKETPSNNDKFKIPKSSFEWGKKPIAPKHSFDSKNDSIYSFIRLLYNKGIISKEKIIENLKNYNQLNKLLNIFFLPELIEIDPNNYFSIIRMFNNISDERYISMINKYWPDKIDLYKKMIDNFLIEDELTKSLRNDDVDTLQLIITRNQIDIPKAVVPFNIFDNLDENPTIINYACLYGSIKCFKYLLLNNAEIDEVTTYFAVYGGNIEIIKIVDQRKSDVPQTNKTYNNNNNNFMPQSSFNNDDTKMTKSIQGVYVSVFNPKSDNSIISSTIIMHRNELFDWLFEKRFVNKNKIGNSLEYLAFLSAINGNAHSLIEIIDKGYDISSKSVIFKAAKNGFYTLTKLLMSIMNQKIDRDKNDLNSTVDYISIVKFNNLSIFKLFLKKLDSISIEKAIIYAIRKNYRNIINYFFDKIDSIDLNHNCNNFIVESLNASFNSKTDELYNFLTDKFKVLFPKIFNLKLYLHLIVHACQCSNFLATKKITDLILNENPKQDFSLAFIEACSSGSINICQYFIEKKVCINYDCLSSKVSQLGTIDDKLFEMIINNVKQSIKSTFFGCIYQAISNKNKKLIEFLLKEKAPMKDALFEAVSTHDIEIVDLILKYNSKPSFINQKRNIGTVLHVACENKDLTIVKRLLSIPGIDASLFNCTNKSALSIAIKNYDIDIIDVILDFYGDDFKSQDILIDNAICEFNMICSSYDDNNFDKRLAKVIKRFAQIKSINPNYIYDSSTLLYKACFSECYEVVESLLEFEKIDVNMYNTDSYNTPLIAAVIKNYPKIVELLINFPKTDINLRDINDDSALIIAVKSSNYQICNLLLKSEKFDPIESKIDYSFYLAANETAKTLTSYESLDVNFIYTIDCTQQEFFIPEESKKTSLIKAVENNDIEKIELIVNHHSFNKDKSNINKAIFIAAKRNNIIVFKQLLKIINDDISIHLNDNDESLLITSAKNLSGEIIDDILSRPQFDPSNNQIIDAFIFSYISFESKQYNQQQQHQWNGWIHPPQNLNLIPNKITIVEMMNKIYDYDKANKNLIDLNKLFKEGKSVFTCIGNDFDGIKEVSDFLLEKGADPNMPDKNGTFPLEHAINIGSLDLIISLINSNKIDFNQIPNGNSYLHVSAKSGNEVIFKFFLETNLFDVNALNNDGETPLMMACKGQNCSNIDLLFKQDNLDYLHCDKNGNDALNIIGELDLSEEKEARKSKEAYHLKLISLIKERYDNNNNTWNDNNFLL